MNKSLKNRMAVLIFTLPALIIFTVVVCYPIIQTLTKSLYDWDGFSTPKFILFHNYARLFNDSVFLTAVKNGLIFAAVLVVYQIGLGTTFALILLNKKLRFKKFFRSSFFIPVVLSISVVCQLWVNIFNPERGLLNKLFEILGSGFRQEWLYGQNSSIFAIAFTNGWQYLGIIMVLMYTAAKSIPEHYFEAALIDGATPAQTHFLITVPLLAESFKFCLIIAITGGLTAFSNMFIMTNGGPGTFTYTLTYMMFKSAFVTNEFGYACTSATVLVAECLLATVLINRFVARENITY